MAKGFRFVELANGGEFEKTRQTPARAKSLEPVSGREQAGSIGGSGVSTWNPDSLQIGGEGFAAERNAEQRASFLAHAEETRRVVQAKSSA